MEFELHHYKLFRPNWLDRYRHTSSPDAEWLAWSFLKDLIEDQAEAVMLPIGSAHFMWNVAKLAAGDYKQLKGLPKFFFELGESVPAQCLSFPYPETVEEIPAGVQTGTFHGKPIYRCPDECYRSHLSRYKEGGRVGPIPARWDFPFEAAGDPGDYGALMEALPKPSEAAPVQENRVNVPERRPMESWVGWVMRAASHLIGKGVWVDDGEPGCGSHFSGDLGSMLEAIGKQYRVLWAVQTNTDLTEGRGEPIVIGVCSDRETALKLAHRRGVMGSDAQVVQIDVPSSLIKRGLIDVKTF